ncbi:MAG: ABC transporter permease [Bryobacterales bacterium]|nr:ABC transporter permease [Bryobacterales bacterium]
MMIFEYHRWLALTIKEFQQLRKNKQLLIQLLIPPSLALVAFGFALNPDVKNLRLGVVDESASPQSRELLDALTANQAFKITARYPSISQLEDNLAHSRLDLGIVIPFDYARDRIRNKPADVQVLIDAVNANTARLAQGYLSESLMSTMPMPARHVESVARIYYNPGAVHAWFFTTGSLCVMLFINASLVASALAVREKEIGTIEQLLMSPAQTAEVLLAKTVPVLIIMMVVFCIGMVTSMVVFGMPQHGSWLLLLIAALLLVISGIGTGVTVATFSASQQQAQLLTFFMLPPIVLISGAFAPADSMPKIFQWLSVLDPVKYMARIVRAVSFKAAGFETMWPELLALGAFTLILFTLSAWRFRSQLQ